MDLAYPAQHIAVEYEGADHLRPDRVVRDGRRHTRFADLGWTVFRYFASDVYRTPDRTVSEIRRALHRAAV